METLEGASHAALQESGVDLMEILRLNGFAPRRASDPVSLTKDESFTPPSPKELEKAFDGLNGLRSVVSPVFSARATTERSSRAWAVPFEENRPVLLVGNHQTIAPDLGFIIEAFIKERGVLPRGLAHPVVAGGGFGAGAAAAAANRKEADADAPSRCPSASPPRPARWSSPRRSGVGRCRRDFGARRRRDEPSRRRRRRRRFEPVHRVRRGSRLRQEPVQASRRRASAFFFPAACARRSSARTRSTLFSGRHGPSSCAWRRGTAP